MVTAPAKQLTPPCIVFSDTQKVLNGGTFGMQSDKFLRPAIVNKLALILASREIDGNQAEYVCFCIYFDRIFFSNFIQQLLRRLELYGVTIGQRDFFEWTHDIQRDIECLDKLSRDGYDYALVIGESDQLHSSLKFKELKTRIVTQNICPKTIKKANNSLFDNLAFKFNLKAGGLNWNIASDPGLITKLHDRDLL